MPAFPFDLNNLLNFQFDQLKLALEYLAKQQGDQQILINELLGKGGKSPRKTANNSEDDNDEISPKDMGDNEIDENGNMVSPLQSSSQATRMVS